MSLFWLAPAGVLFVGTWIVTARVRVLVAESAALTEALGVTATEIRSLTDQLPEADELVARLSGSQTTSARPSPGDRPVPSDS